METVLNIFWSMVGTFKEKLNKLFNIFGLMFKFSVKNCCRSEVAPLSPPFKNICTLFTDSI